MIGREIFPGMEDPHGNPQRKRGSSLALRVGV
jgi:hypothetical protein